MIEFIMVFIFILFTILYIIQLVILWVDINSYDLEYLGIKTKKDLFIHHIPFYIPILKSLKYIEEIFKDLK